MKKRAILILTTILLLTSLASCGEQTTSTSNTVTPTPTPLSTPNITETQNTTSENKNISVGNNTEYHSFLSLDGDTLSFNFTVDEFINNYNKVKSSYDSYKDIEISDFVMINSSAWSDENTTIYGCPLTILGRNDGIMIMLEIGDSSNEIKCISLGVQDYVVYQNSEDYLNTFELQYSLLIQSLGLSSTEVSNILSDMDYNETTKGNYGLYTKGLGLYYSTESNCAYYRITAFTKEQAQNIGRLKDVIKE
ncbi:MAG: hypothetical protein ACLRQ0_09680 [Monoglobales bacterium]